jgi:hypothetical protein
VRERGGGDYKGKNKNRRKCVRQRKRYTDRKTLLERRSERA